MTIILALLLSIFKSFALPIYQMEDLEVLYEEKNFSELIAHAYDIAPSKRDDKWSKLIKSTLEKWFQSPPSAQSIGLISNIYSWPIVKNDEFLALKTNTYISEHLDLLLRPLANGEVLFFKYLPATILSDADISFKIFEKTYPQHPQATQYLDNALKTELSEFYCQKQLVQNHIWQKLIIFNDSKRTYYIQNNLHNDCFKSMKVFLKDILHKNSLEVSEKLIAYRLLDDFKMLEDSDKDFFLIQYYLSAPRKGQILNASWNTLNDLRTKPERREKILAMLQNLSHLPDQSFSLTESRVYLSQLQASFPEFLDYYFDLCYKFYKTKQSFPKGNPTKWCQKVITHHPEFVKNKNLDLLNL